MRLSDEFTEKFEIELANEQAKKIKQAINDCQLRFGKVMGCGTCKASQLCIWAKELSSTIESMGKYIEALQAENKQLKEQINTAKIGWDTYKTYSEQLEQQTVELLRKARKALHKGISELKIHCKYFAQTPEEDACIEMHEAVVEIDKAIGGTI